MEIDTWTLDSLRKLQIFSSLPILFRCILFKLVSTPVIYKTDFLSLYPYNMGVLIKLNLLIYLLKRAPHWPYPIFSLYLYFYSFLICHISFHFFDYKKYPWFLFWLIFWIFADYAFLIKFNCLLKIFAHIFCIIVHLIIEKLDCLIVSVVYI